MSDTNPKAAFFAKTWIHYVMATVFTALALFSVILGPLFLFDVIKRADGRPGTEAGIAMSIMAVPLGLVAILGWFNVFARRRPLLRICRDGIEINVIGSSSLDGVPLVPTILRLAWLIASLQGFKKQIGWVPWTLFRSVEVIGLPMMRTMIIEGTIVYPTFELEELKATIGQSIAFRDAEFVTPLEQIALAIRMFHDDPTARDSLPSLHG